MRLRFLAGFFLLAAGIVFAQAPQPTAAQPVPIGNLQLQNASLVEVIDQLARQLHINYLLDPAVKGGVTLNTYGNAGNIDARNLLELILRVNGAAMVQEGEIFHIVPSKDAVRLPIRPQINARDIPEDDQLMLNLVFLKYVTVEEITKILGEFTGQSSSMFSYTPANLLFILDSRRNVRRTMDLISLFDSDTFANQRVRLFEVKDARPSDLVKDLENVLKSISLDGKTNTVRFLPVDRINTLIAVAPNPGIFEVIEDWLKKLDVPVRVPPGSASENHVYRLRYGRAECISLALNQLYGIGGSGYGVGGGYSGGFGGGGFGGYPGAGGFGGGGGFGYPNSGTNNYPTNNQSGTYGSGNSFNNNFGGLNNCGGMSNGMGGYGGGGGSYGYPAFGGYAAQVPAAITGTGILTGAPSAPTTSPSAGENRPTQVRIVANPLDNALIIQATSEQYQGILRVLKDLDVPPRQILLEAKIYSVDLSGSFAGGVSAQFQRTDSTKDRGLLGTLSSTAGLAGAALQVGTLVGKSKELLAFLNLSENASRTRILSEPSLIATDSIPASLNVGTQVPVQTSSQTVSAGTSTTSNSISSHDTGVTLQVNARVNPSGVVTLIINQEVSAPGAGAGSLTPSFDQKVIQTQITLQDGDTIAIGGIISDTTVKSSSGIPGLHRIPYVGMLFGNQSLSHGRSELIVFMTPHVIFDESDLIEASNELRDRVRKLRHFVREL